MKAKLKTKITLIYYAAVAAICVMFVSMSTNAFKVIDTQVSNVNVVREKPVFVIDAGHGGEDGGAVSAEGLIEKDVNLSIALKLEKLLRFSGFDVVMTRTEDISIHDEGTESVKKRKTSDLKNRLELCNSNSANIFVSIHQNQFTDSQYDGAQVFYSPNNSKSQLMATSIREAFRGLLQPENEREIKKADSNIFLLKYADVPAVVVECGFLSNPDEAYLLSTDEYRSNVAFTIYCGLLDYYNNNYKA